MSNLIRYDLLAQAALRGVVRTVLEDVAEKGLPGDHHFKITFATGAPGVRLSERMRAQYPQAMTIILQHQFWDLAVREDAFDIGLSFGGVGEKLTVPFAAVIAFLDPVAEFALQFEAAEAEGAGDAEGAEHTSPEAKKIDALPTPVAEAPARVERRNAGAEGGGEVVSLDRFRKK
jgi:hypothetical protein